MRDKYGIKVNVVGEILKELRKNQKWGYELKGCSVHITKKMPCEFCKVEKELIKQGYEVNEAWRLVTEELWSEELRDETEEEIMREAVIAEYNAKRLAGKWYCWDCGYSGDEKEFKMIDEDNIQCPQCQGINTSPAISPRLTVCENCGTVIPVEIAEKNYGFCDLCRETEEKRIEEETKTLKLLKELFF